MIRRNREPGGQSMVEFALILPVFILVLVGILDFGRAIYAYNTISNAAREASRLAIVDQTVGDIRTAAVDHATSLGVPAASVYVDFRIPETPEVADSCDAKVGTAAAVGCLAIVRVPYDYSAATPILAQIIGPIAMSAESRFRIEADCVEPTDPSCPIGD